MPRTEPDNPTLRPIIGECACNQCGQHMWPGEQAYGTDEMDGSISWTCEPCHDEQTIFGDHFDDTKEPE